jgi:hypothetical protein
MTTINVLSVFIIEPFEKSLLNWEHAVNKNGTLCNFENISSAYASLN